MSVEATGSSGSYESVPDTIEGAPTVLQPGSITVAHIRFSVANRYATGSIPVDSTDQNWRPGARRYSIQIVLNLVTNKAEVLIRSVKFATITMYPDGGWSPAVSPD